jgi:hypothetical protein
MEDWKFKVFLKDKTTNVIADWLNGLPKEDRAKIRTRINYLKTAQPPWPKTFCKKYVPYEKIYELLIQRYRPLGFFGPGAREFTLLIGAKEKGDKMIPKTAPETAESRRKLIIEEEGYTNDFV